MAHLLATDTTVSVPEWSALFTFAEANIMYVAWNPSRVLHFANLLTVSIVGRQFKTTAQCRHLSTELPNEE